MESTTYELLRNTPPAAPAFPENARVYARHVKTRIFEINIARMLAAVNPLLNPERRAIVQDFFTNHLFMPADRRARDQAVEALYDKMKSVSVMDFSENLRESVELTKLANDLDESLVRILAIQHGARADRIGPEQLDSAIRDEGRFADRCRQVELLCNNIRFFHKLSHAPFARFILPSMRLFAKATGVSCLVAQIDAGYRAAKAISDIDEFVGRIQNQEIGRLVSLFDASVSN